MSTELDYEQVIKKVYDEAGNRLRTDASLTASSVTVTVAIDQATDSIKVGDGTDLLAVNTDGSVNVNRFNHLLNGIKFDSVKVAAKNSFGPTIVEYYQGGLAGTLNATLTMTYDVDGDLYTIVRT